MITKLLSLNFLTKYIDITSFNLFKNSYNNILLDGHFNKELTDKELAALLFENSVTDEFFRNKKNLKDFCYALPEIVQKKIVKALKVKRLEELNWNLETSNFFINELGLDEKFSYRDSKTAKENTALIKFEKPGLTFKKLKQYQAILFYSVYEYIRFTPFSRCIIQMPTGSGKTRTSMEIVCEVINDTGKDVLWLANTQELCDQAFESFVEVWTFLRKRKAQAINHIRIKGKLADIESDVPTFHVSSLQSLNSKNLELKLDELGIDINKLELLVVDEAHISIAPTYRNAITNIVLSGTKLIGLTATPGRHLKNIKKNENKDLGDFYNNMLFELDTKGEEPIEYLRNRGILSNAYFVSIEGSTLEKTINNSEIKKSIENKSIPKSIEHLLTNDVKRNAIIFDQLVSLIKENKKILFFATSIEHSKLICSLLKIKGYPAAHVDGNSGKFRSQIISDFKKGQIQILCNYGILSTGFDDPKIDVVFMARPTNSIVLYSQIIGRGLRGPLIGGTDYCEIYTVFDNILDLPDNNEIYSYFDEYFINFNT